MFAPARALVDVLVVSLRFHSNVGPSWGRIGLGRANAFLNLVLLGTVLDLVLPMSLPKLTMDILVKLLGPRSRLPCEPLQVYNF